VGVNAVPLFSGGVSSTSTPRAEVTYPPSSSRKFRFTNTNPPPEADTSSSRADSAEQPNKLPSNPTQPGQTAQINASLQP